MTLDTLINENSTAIPTLYDVVKKFRNYLRLNRASSKASTHTAFAILQKENSEDSTTETSIELLKAERTPPKCLCDELHFFSQCPYLIRQQRPKNWVANEQIQKQVEEKMAKSPRVRDVITTARKKANQQHSRAQNSRNKTKQTSELQEDSSQQQKQTTTATTTLTSFAVDQSNYELRDTWILDSGANSHVCNDRTRFKFERVATEDDKLVAGKAVYSIEAFGSVEITVKTLTGSKTLTLLDVALAPGFFTNTASLHKFTRKGVHWDTEKQRLHANGETFCLVQRVGTHWALEHTPIPSTTAFASSFTSSKDSRSAIEAPAERWHAILGHPGREPVSNLQNNTKGARVTSSTDSAAPCETCALSKAREIVSRRSDREIPVEKPLERVGFDLIQMSPAYNNHEWISHFRCFHTGVDFVYTHSKKSQTTDIVVAFFNLVERQYKLSVRFFRTDGETSLGGKFDEVIAKKGIKTERSAPATPAQNGAAERAGGMIIMKARCMRISSHLPTNMWPEVVKTAAYLNNRTPKRQLGWMTPHEAITGLKPNLSHLHVFGCRAYPLDKHIPRKQKLQPRAHIGYLTGYDSTNIYRIWIPSQQKIVRTRDVTFDETRFYDPSDLDLGYILRQKIPQIIEVLEPYAFTDSEPSTIADEDYDEILDSALSAPATWPVPSSPKSASKSTSSQESSAPTASLTLPITPEPTPEPPTQPTSATEPMTSSSPVGELPVSTPVNLPFDSLFEAPAPLENRSDFDARNILPESSRRSRNPRRHNYATALQQTTGLNAFHTAFATGIKKGGGAKIHRDTLPAEPRSWKQMLRHQCSEEFTLAASREIQELTKKGTYKWVSKQAVTTTPLPLLWVFKYKFDTDGYLTKFKARLCVRGDLQSTEQDTYAATLAARTFRALMAVSAAFDLENHQYDAVNAFLNSRLNETIHCHPPEGFETLDRYWLLLQALYGLKQSPLLWYTDFTIALEELGLRAVSGVNCLFVNDFLILFFYVDDIVILYSKQNKQRFLKFEASLLQRFEMRTLGELKWFLGIRVERERSTRRIWLCQDSYASKLAAKFNVCADGKPPRTPMFSEDLLLPEAGYKATAQQILAYQQRVGSLSFAAAISRPDIAHATSRLSSFLQNPTQAHLAAANRTIQYLCSTRGYAIEYSGENTSQIFKCASDAAYADDVDTRRSSDGFLFQLYGGAIDWRAGKQKTVTTSSTEAELLSLSTAAREVIWWRRFFAAIKFDTQQPVEIDCDNLQTLRILTKEAVKLDTKLRHIDIHQHWLRQEVQEGRIALKWLPTAEMPADGLTKPLPAQKHATFVRQLNLVDISTKFGDIGHTNDAAEAAKEGKEAGGRYAYLGDF